MPIPTKVDSLEEIPEQFHDAYEEKDGEFHLIPPEGFAPNKKLAEFRDNNKTLEAQLEELRAHAEKFKDVDPEKYKEMQEQTRQLEEKELIKAGDIDPIVEARTKPLLEAKDREIEELTSQIDAANGNLSRLMVEDKALDILLKKGLNPDMTLFARRHAADEFVVKNGKVVALDEGGAPRYEQDGFTPIALNENWSESVKKSYPSMFYSGGGGGAEDGGGQRGPGQLDRSEMSAAQKIQAGFEDKA